MWAKLRISLRTLLADTTKSTASTYIFLLLNYKACVMSKLLDSFLRSQSLIYRGILYIALVGAIVFFFPKGGQFKYEFQKGKPWQYNNLYAPFDFAILKTQEEIKQEQEQLENEQIPYYRYDSLIVSDIYVNYEKAFPGFFPDSQFKTSELEVLSGIGRGLLDSIFANGIWDGRVTPKSQDIYLVKNNIASPIRMSQILRIAGLNEELERLFKDDLDSENRKRIKDLFFDVIQPNVSFDEALTRQELELAFKQISITRGTVFEGTLIIAQGEVVEADNYKILVSLKAEYESELWSSRNAKTLIAGYIILVALVLLMLLLFIRKYRPKLFQNNVQLTFVFFNIFIMVFVTTLVVNYNPEYVFVVPLSILPLIVKTFFDARLGLFVHVLTVLLLGFIVPNSFEFIFLQIIAGIATILTVSELYKRANLFISVGQITLIYIVGYFAFNVIQEGDLTQIVWANFVYFLVNGMITLFVQPLIYIYEKIFGMVSDVSLLELSDTNSKLLKELSDKAPGTFNHSLQVANLAEACANEVGANAMLARVGALYHDIGKIVNPTFFTENQITNLNPHDDLAPGESAKIIIQHVLNGIELARKYKLPDRIIDFIRTHHGTTLVYYFYKKAKDVEGDGISDAQFRYPGPIPFSKETAIIMMSDSVEAASKSLVNPTYLAVEEFVDRIVTGQVQSGQFLNANITFKEIETVKKVLKQRLMNIYHIRVEYPE